MKSARISQAGFVGLLLVLIVALGAVLRIVNLDADSIWLDEAYTIQFAHLAPAPLIAEIAASDVHPPLYYLAVHYWVGLFGDSEAAVRSLSTLFGLLSILMLYAVAALLCDRAVGLLSALLAALSLFHIEYAQEARMYTLLLLLTLCSFYFFLKLFLAEARALHTLGYLVSTSLLMHTHVYGFFIIFAENLFFLSLYFSRREVFKRLLARWLLLQAVLVVLFVPWLSIQLRQFARVRHGFWIPRPPLEFLRLTWLLHAGSKLLALLFIPLIALGLWRRRRARSERLPEEGSGVPLTSGAKLPFSEREKTLLLLLWFLSPILIPFVVSQFASLPSIYLPKYTLAASCAFLILAARGVMNVNSDRARVALVALLLGLSFIQIRAYWSGFHKDFWRQSAGYFDRTARGGDLVLFHQESGQVPFQYYSKRKDVALLPLTSDKAELMKENAGAALRPLVAGHKRIWLVASHPTEVTALVTKQLGEWYKLAEHRLDPGVELYLFEMGAEPIGPPVPEEK